jgi:hypothetical protein
MWPAVSPPASAGVLEIVGDGLLLRFRRIVEVDPVHLLGGSLARVVVDRGVVDEFGDARLDDRAGGLSLGCRLRIRQGWRRTWRLS